VAFAGIPLEPEDVARRKTPVVVWIVGADAVDQAQFLQRREVLVQGGDGHFRILGQPRLLRKTAEIQVVTVAEEPQHDLRGRLRPALLDSRCGEARTATFDQFNLYLAIWTKQTAHTKQRRVHRLPISHEAVALIRLRRDAVPKGCLFLFPGDVPSQPVVDLKRFWERMHVQADIPDVRIHDLRHAFASLLVSGGASMEMIGRLLGRTQIGTTQRYAHLIDAPLRAGVSAVGEMLKPRLKVVGA